MVRIGKVILILACMAPVVLSCGCRQQASRDDPNEPGIGQELAAKQVVHADNTEPARTDRQDQLPESPSGQDQATAKDTPGANDSLCPNGDEPQEPQATGAEGAGEDPADTEARKDPADTEARKDPADTEAGKGQPEQAATEPDKTPAKQTEGRTTAEQDRPEFYAKYERVLRKYVDKNGNVDYPLLRRKRGDIVDVANAFDRIKLKEQINWSDNEKIAMWINAYNIFTLKVIIDNYPIKPLWWASLMYPVGIMHIPGAWEKTYFRVMGSQYTLREIERENLLGQFRDPRTCFALSYASMGGAFLRNEPFYPEQLDKQLDEQVRKFVRDQRGVKIDRDNNVLYLSDIFIWYKQDLIDKYGDIKSFRDREPDIRAYLNFIVEYLPKKDAEYLRYHDFAVKFLRYDWQLNDQPRK